MKSQLIRAAALTAVAMIAFTWSNLVFGGEIHEAAAGGDLEKVTALLKDNPELVNSRDNGDITPLHWAALWGHGETVLQTADS